MSSTENLQSTIKRFKSLKQHRDLVEAQYEHVRKELAMRFDELGITEMQDGEDTVIRTFYRRYEYDLPLLKRELHHKTFGFVTETKIHIVPNNFHQAVKTGAINEKLAEAAKKLVTNTDMIRIVKQ